MNLASAFGAFLDPVADKARPAQKSARSRPKSARSALLSLFSTPHPQLMVAAALVLLSTTAALPFTDFAFAPDDILMVGRESAGAPPEVHEAADARILIPIRPGMRSLNVAVCAAMALGEALRQTDLYPQTTPSDP